VRQVAAGQVWRACSGLGVGENGGVEVCWHAQLVSDQREAGPELGAVRARQVKASQRHLGRLATARPPGN
jgi:hypothetical protein